MSNAVSRRSFIQLAAAASAAAETVTIGGLYPVTGSFAQIGQGCVNAAKLAVLAAPYPQVVAGTPRDWSFRSGTFRLCYSTARADRAGRFSPGAPTFVSVPPIEYPNGYRVTVQGGQVVSAPNAPVLAIVANPGADAVDLVVTP